AELGAVAVPLLPFAPAVFDLVTGVKPPFGWPALPPDMREVLRVLKPGGRLIIIAEIYRGAQTRMAKVAKKSLPLSGMTLLTVDEHRDLFPNAGYSDVQIITEPEKGWICGVGMKPA